MAKVNMVATVPYKGREAGATFETSAKNARALEEAGTATAKKTAARKVPAKKATKKAPAKKAGTYKTRALKAK